MRDGEWVGGCRAAHLAAAVPPSDPTDGLSLAGAGLQAEGELIGRLAVLTGESPRGPSASGRMCPLVCFAFAIGGVVSPKDSWSPCPIVVALLPFGAPVAESLHHA